MIGGGKAGNLMSPNPNAIAAAVYLSSAFNVGNGRRGLFLGSLG